MSVMVGLRVAINSLKAQMYHRRNWQLARRLPKKLRNVSMLQPPTELTDFAIARLMVLKSLSTQSANSITENMTIFCSLGVSGKVKFIRLCSNQPKLAGYNRRQSGIYFYISRLASIRKILVSLRSFFLSPNRSCCVSGFAQLAYAPTEQGASDGIYRCLTH